jgi:hypothetical protein
MCNWKCADYVRQNFEMAIDTADIKQIHRPGIYIPHNLVVERKFDETSSKKIITYTIC